MRRRVGLQMTLYSGSHGQWHARIITTAEREQPVRLRGLRLVVSCLLLLLLSQPLPCCASVIVTAELVLKLWRLNESIALRPSTVCRAGLAGCWVHSNTTTWRLNYTDDCNWHAAPWGRPEPPSPRRHWCSTPTVERVEPAVVRPGAVIRVHGKGIPPSDPWPGEVRVYVGKNNDECLQDCSVPTHSARRSIRCRLPDSIKYGAHNVTIHVPGIGYSVRSADTLRLNRAGTAPHDLQVAGRVLSVHPRAGSASGGSLLTLHAEGIQHLGPDNASSVSVSVDGVACDLRSGSPRDGVLSCSLAPVARQAERQTLPGNATYAGGPGAVVQTWQWQGSLPSVVGLSSLRASMHTLLATADRLPSTKLRRLGWDRPGGSPEALLTKVTGFLRPPHWATHGASGNSLRLRIHSTAVRVELWLCARAVLGTPNATDELYQIAAINSGNGIRVSQFSSPLYFAFGTSGCHYELVAVEVGDKPQFTAVEALLSVLPPSHQEEGEFFTVLPGQSIIRLTAAPQSALQRVTVRADANASLQLQWGLSPRFSPPLWAQSNAISVQAAVERLATNDCSTNDELLGPDAALGTAIRFSFEHGEMAHATDAVTTLQSAFCGRRSLVGNLGATLNFPAGVHTKAQPFLCMAYLFQGWDFTFSSREIAIHIQGIGTRYVILSPSVGLQATLPAARIAYWAIIADNHWHTTCLDIDLALDRAFGGQDHILTRLSLSHLPAAPNFFIDEFIVRSNMKHSVRYPYHSAVDLGGLVLNSAAVLMPSGYNATNASVASAVWNIELTAANCPAASFPLLQLTATDNSETYTAAEVRSLGLALDGHWEIIRPNHLPVAIPARATKLQLMQLLAGMVSNVTILEDHCYDKTLLFEYESTDVPSFNVSMCSLSGENASVTVEKRTRGGFLMRDIPEDWLAVPVQLPQLHVTVDSLPLTCSEQNCNFSFTEPPFYSVHEITAPTCVISRPRSDVVLGATTFGLSSLNDTLCPAGLVMCMSGLAYGSCIPYSSRSIAELVKVETMPNCVSGFDSHILLNVAVESANFSLHADWCSQYSVVSGGLVTCSPRASKTGFHNLTVQTPELGNGRTNTSMFYPLLLHKFSLSTHVSSMMGGAEISVNGWGFGESSEESIVLFGKHRARVVSSNASSIVCIVPAIACQSSTDNVSVVVVVMVDEQIAVAPREFV